MIKKLRRKIILIIWAILAMVFAGVLLVVNISNYKSVMKTAENVLNKMADAERNMHGGFSHTLPAKDQTMNRSFQFFTVSIQGDEKEIKINNSTYSEEEILEAAEDIIDSKSEDGRMQNIMYKVFDRDDESIIACVDMGASVENQRRMIMYSIFIMIPGMIISAIIAWFLSTWLVRPVEEAFNKQKDFIADACHELKTPVTVISANIDMLEMTDSENEHLHYIREELGKMSTLIQELLMLAKLEASDSEAVHAEFDLSRAVSNTCLPFESVAYEHSLALEISTPEKAVYKGNEEQLKKVIGILTDNAIQHANANSVINITLKQDKNRYILRVTNEGDEIAVEDRDKIFEKFYRVDKARNRSSGRYGLGLSIAKNIVQKHNGSINVDCADGKTTFILKL